ncbi:MAG: hypothetical protein KGI38_00550 [Thaumarchaeota archaeon]|nr:hypothetical protein [Nitrososphaerota archaeon]
MTTNLREKGRDRRKQALDNALLFLSSTVPFGFSIIAIAFGLPLYGLVAFGPLLILAVVFPLYVGYMRGVIELDSLSERARGWVYLIYGSGFYSLLIVSSQIGHLSQALVDTPLNLVIWIIGFAGLPWLMRQFVIWMYRVIERDAVPIRDAVGIASTAAVLSVASIGFYAIGTLGGLLGYTVEPVSVVDAIGIIMTSSLFILPLLLIESNCHRYLDVAVRKIPRSNYASSRPEFLDRFGRAMDRYSRYTTAVLWAGASHRKQYGFMLVGYVLDFGGLTAYLRAPYVSLLLISLGVLIFLAALIWHIRTNHVVQ